MNQQINQLIEKEKYQEAIPIAERVVAVAKRVWGSEQPETVHTLDNLGFLFQKIGDYARAEPLSRPVCAQHGRMFIDFRLGLRLHARNSR